MNDNAFNTAWGDASGRAAASALILATLAAVLCSSPPHQQTEAVALALARSRGTARTEDGNHVSGLSLETLETFFPCRTATGVKKGKEAGEKRRNGRNTERNGRVRGREGLASP